MEDLYMKICDARFIVRQAVATGSMVMLFAVSASCQQTQPSTTQPAATQPAETQPATTRPSDTVDPQVELWLDRIEQQSDKIKTLKAKLRYDYVQGLQGDEQRRFGRLIYVAGPPKKFAIHFDRLLVDEAIREQNKWLIFDGEWLVERDDDKKQFNKRQIVAPLGDDGEAADRVDALAIGTGPFVIPIGGKKADMLKRFAVELVDDGDDAPKRTENTVHLRLIPRPGHDTDFTYLDMWYDKDLLLAVRIETYKEASEDEKIFVLWDAVVNEEVDEGMIDTGEPVGGDYDVEVTPWRE